MPQQTPTIAVLSTSPALASILGAALRQSAPWRVREFRDPRALNAYMRIAPVSLLVCDYQLGASTAAEVASALRCDPQIVSHNLQIVAMSRTVDPAMRRDCISAGIDEVIVKPMSPLYLQERVTARLSTAPSDHIVAEGVYSGPERRNRIYLDDPRPLPIERRSGNVVSFAAHKALRETRPSA